jgi:hypothetical protein
MAVGISLGQGGFAMSRLRIVLLTMLGIASLSLVLAARITSRVSSDRDSITLTRTTTVSTGTGLVAGLTGWPQDMFCAGLTSGTMQTLDPKYLLGRLQLAAKCRLTLVIVPPRRRISVTGINGGAFSVDSAKRLTNEYAQILVPDTLRKYRTTILGFNLADDYGCTTCWGDKGISQSQIRSWASYTRARIPGLPLGVRVTPDWVQKDSTLAPLLDYAWAQYTTRKGDPQTFYDKSAAIAKKLGLQIVMGVNVEDCAGTNTDPCSATELVRFGTIAVNHPASCAFLSWQYDATTWEQEEIRTAWNGLVALAQQRPRRECRRSSGVL